MSIKKAIDKINPRAKVWILFTFIFKISLTIYLYYCKTGNFPTLHTLFIHAGDTFSYFDPIDNLITKGKYEPFYRMHGIGAIYYFFRVFFEQKVAYSFFTIFQIILDSLACYALARLAYEIIKSKLFFILTLILSITNTYFSIFNFWLLSESICTSTLILSLYFLYKAINENKIKLYLTSGFFITWAIFCRPVYFPFLIIYVLTITIFLYKRKQKNISISILAFILSFIIIDSIWVYAGIKHSKEVVFLQHSNLGFNQEEKKEEEAYLTEDWKMALYDYVGSFGGDIVSWNPYAEISWFDINMLVESKRTSLPSYAFTNTVTLDSLSEIKKNIQIMIRSSASLKTKDSLNIITKEKLYRYTARYIKEKPFHYYITSRVIILKQFIFQQATYNLYNKAFSDLNYFEKTIKLFYFLLYYIYILFSIISIFIILLDRKRIILFLPIILITLYGIGIYPLLRMCEYRYLAPIVPFLILLSAYSIYIITTTIYERKNTLS